MDHKKYFDNLCDSIDATVFNGDYLYTQEALDEFKTMLNRWGNKVKVIQEIIDEIKKEGI